MKKHFIILWIVVVIIFFIISFVEYKSYVRITNNFTNNIISTLVNNYPDVTEEEIIEIINSSDNEASDILASFGIDINSMGVLKSINDNFYRNLIINSIVLLVISIVIFLLIFFYDKKEKRELDKIIDYLKELNRGNYDLKIDLNSEGILSILKNEIYTTTVMLREMASREYLDKITLKENLANISHQLKTPLTSIAILVDNLCDEEVDKKTELEFLNDIKRQVDNINYLVIVLLKLSRFDANVITFKKDNINVKKLILECMKNLDVIREVKNINIHVSGANDVEFIGDYKWESEAISNIIKNAIEHTLNDKNIYISFKDKSIYTEIIIEDEGLGMSEKEKNRIFERFYKGSSTNSNNFGIGLSLAKEIITKDNGKIIVKSEVNKGTKFIIRYYK